jgi:DNA-binding NarL/FixJ family response regulator
MVRIAIVEDHIMFRQGLRAMLERNDEFRVVYETDCGEKFEKNFDSGKIDITLLDLRLNGQNGAITCQNIRYKYPDCKIVIISFSEDPDLILEMIRYGARAYIPKSRGIEYVEHTLRMVNEHGHYFDQDLGEMMNVEMQKAHKKTFIDNEFRVEFNSLEMRVTTLSCSGLTIEEIAEELKVSRRHVETQRANLQAKTGSDNFQGVIIYMFKHYLLFPQQF